MIRLSGLVKDSQVKPSEEALRIAAKAIALRALQASHQEHLAAPNLPPSCSE